MSAMMAEIQQGALQCVRMFWKGTVSSLEADIRDHGFPVHVVPVVVEVSRDIFDVAVRKCIWKEPANPNFSDVYEQHIVAQPFATDDPLICRYQSSAIQVLRATYKKHLERSISPEVREWLETQIAGLASHALAIETEPGYWYTARDGTELHVLSWPIREACEYHPCRLSWRHSAMQRSREHSASVRPGN